MTIPAEQFSTPIPLDRDRFMRQLIAGFGHLNEGILGSDVTGAYVMNVGLSMGAAIEAEYKRFWGIDRPFTLDEYAHVIVDLKQKIQGNFSIVSKDPDKVVVRTTSCPFDAFVRQSPSLCFMTSSVFGGIAARNFGYAKVVLHQRIALGDPGCHVTVYLRRTPEADAAVGRQYFPDVDQASPDIAEQLRLMDNLRNLRRELSRTASRWEEVVRGAADAIAVVDTDGHVTVANARWRELLGVEGEELVGEGILRLVHEDDLPLAEVAVRRVLAGERIPAVRVRLRHRDGRWREAQLSLGPSRDDEHGRVSGLLIIGRDITAERQAERLKDALLAAASHELRTPVSIIRGTAELLMRGLSTSDALDPEKFARRIQAILRQADRLALLERELSDTTRLQSGVLRLATAVHDLNDVAAAVVSRYQGQSPPDSRHRIMLNPAPTALWVRIERARIEQVLDNLLANAIKYSPEGGEVVVLLDHERAPAGVMARLRVCDVGIGIPAADLPQMFTPFFRGSNASIRNFGGLGLGLYLSRELAVAHGGELSIESEEGQGATVTLELPLVEPASLPRDGGA